MPTLGGPVYQPTTVSFETRAGGVDGSAGGSAGPFLGANNSLHGKSAMRGLRKPRPQIALLVVSLLCLIAGVTIILSCSFDLMSDNGGAEQAQEQQEKEIFSATVFVVLGVFLILVCFIGLGMYLRNAEWRRHCVCPCACPFFDKKQSLARTLQCQSGNGNGITALNPSTDPLMSHTQYAPVSELPSLRPEDEERSNLMPPEQKDCLSSAEESDRMLEPDPRIVLCPMKRVEDA